jgi:membrane-bound lytic murein transglycosylase D
VTASASPRSISYLVRHGDTLQAIASRFAVTIAQVKEWNRLKSTTIRPGQRLVLVPSKNQDYGG